MTAILQLHPDYTDVLQCPMCGGPYVEVDSVEITAADGPRVRVNAASDLLEMQALPAAHPDDAPVRYCVTLNASCLTCSGFRLELHQIEGRTLVLGQPR